MAWRNHVSLPKALLALVFLAPAAWALAPVGKFVPSAEVVADTQTGLTWQKVVGATKVAWPAASTYCDQLSLDGKDDWRLPQLQELYSLVDFNVAGVNPYIDATAFADTPFGMFWSATLTPPAAGNARFTVSFGGNYGPTVGLTPPSSPVAFVRCVR